MIKDIEDFLDYYKYVKKSSDNTIQSYKRDLLKMMRFMLVKGIDSATDITVTNINAYILDLEKQNLSSSTISRNIASMRAFFKYLIHLGKIDYEPVEFIKAPVIEKKIPEYLSVQDVDKLLSQFGEDTAMEIRDKAIIELLYATGIRVSEMINLKIEDINMQFEYLECDDGKKSRIIPFGKTAKAALEKYLSDSRNEIAKENCGFLFVNCHGDKLSRQGVWKMIKKYGENAGIGSDISPHTIRHSFAAHLIANGAEIKSVKEMMGHSDISSTLIYEGITGDKKRNVYEKCHPRK